MVALSTAKACRLLADMKAEDVYAVMHVTCELRAGTTPSSRRQAGMDSRCTVSLQGPRSARRRRSLMGIG